VNGIDRQISNKVRARLPESGVYMIITFPVITLPEIPEIYSDIKFIML
jgi:hypothetical protein